MSLVMRKPAFCICENKEADQLRGNREADQRFCFRYTASKIPLLHLYLNPKEFVLLRRAISLKVNYEKVKFSNCVFVKTLVIIN